MPYEGEYARYGPIRRVAESSRVRELLGSYRIREQERDPSQQSASTVQVQVSEWKPNLVFALDGSYLTVPIRNGYPGAEAAYVTVASVLLDMEKVRLLGQCRPFDPIELRKTESTGSTDWALPGCNVVFQNEISAVASLRRSLYQWFSSERVAQDSESLLDTYEALLAYKPSSHDQKCPYASEDGCPHDYNRGSGEYSCTCERQRPLFSTDALRIHEGMLLGGTNGAMYAEIMQVVERLWVIHLLRWLENKGWLSSLRRLAIVLDGPLAVFGHPAWLSQAISQELCRINELVRRATGGEDILLMGVEKSGAFVQHLIDLDTQSNGSPGVFPIGSALLLDDSYIKRNIVFSDSTKPYGVDTYFGRKFFYKSRNGSLIVASLPFLHDHHRDTSRAEESQFPRLIDAAGMLDDLICCRYPNAITPLVSAHAEAAIPLNLGRKVLEELARELMEGADA
ncbi:MAG: DNA double-strand break repair nuclease NurA [Armatimonadetes bacterium]|jgi:hypothetical protein|nr:DNA double-strand break repair nuclease NurA [Armatimonadota bacterium]